MKPKKEDLERILKKAGIHKDTPVEFVEGEGDKILAYIPHSSYDNNALGTDTSHVERARILDADGKTLCNITTAMYIKYSDGSDSQRFGESVSDALRKLGKKAILAKYVILEKKDESEDNTVTVSEGPYHSIKGEVTKDDRQLQLYELGEKK